MSTTMNCDSHRNRVTFIVVVALYISQIIQLTVANQNISISLDSSPSLQDQSDQPKLNESQIFATSHCHCMEYWNCTQSHGEIQSYCGIGDSEVCCIFKTETDHANATAMKSSTLRTNELFQLLQLDPQKISTTGTTRLSSKSKLEATSCGYSINHGNIDSVAKFKEWPWHAAILEAKDDLYICGGSFLDNGSGTQLILTAGHCVNNYVNTKQKLKVRLGEYDVSRNSEPLPHVEVLVKEIILHQGFKSNGLANDIAILKLNNSVQLENRSNIRPICLPEFETTNLTNCVVTGWGRKKENSEHSVILKEIPVPIWPNSVCEQKLRNIFGPNYTLSTNLICAGDYGHDACDGDGGGPLVCHENHKWVQRSVVSWGIGCGRGNPGIYTKVSSYVNWIKSMF